MSEDAEIVKAFAALMPTMQQCADVVVSKAHGRRKKRARVIDVLLAEVPALLRGRHDPAFGIADQVADLASSGRALAPRQAAAIDALTAYAHALEAAWDLPSGRTTRDDVLRHLGHARAHAASAEGRGRPVQPAGDIAARVERLRPGDDQELAAILSIVMDHRLVELVPAVLERLGLDDGADTIEHAVRSMARLFHPRSKFADLCAKSCASPNVGTRRWVARALISGLRPEHVPALFPLLSDAEPKVRREAATVLRAAAVWHPETKPSIERATKEALSALPDDLSLRELHASLAAPPPTTR